MTGTEGEKWKELPNRQNDVDTAQCGGTIFMQKHCKKSSKQAASWEAASWKLKKLDKK